MSASEQSWIPEPTLDDQIRELERELAKRSKVYPRLVAIGKMKPRSAAIQNITLTAALETLRAVKRTAPR